MKSDNLDEAVIIYNEALVNDLEGWKLTSWETIETHKYGSVNDLAVKVTYGSHVVIHGTLIFVYEKSSPDRVTLEILPVGSDDTLILPIGSSFEGTRTTNEGVQLFRRVDERRFA